MKVKIKVILTLILTAGFVLNLKSAGIENLAATISKNFNLNSVKKHEVSVPEVHVLIDSSKNSTETADPFLYYPILKKMTYEYSLESTEFVGKKKVIVKFLNYSEKDSLMSGTITYFNKKSLKTVDFTVRINEQGLYNSKPVIGEPRIEIPIPLFKDKRWTENGNKNRVIGFSSAVTTPAGEFKCMKILTKIFDGDTGKIERFYAPGIGLIKEVRKSEEKSYILTLITYYTE